MSLNAQIQREYQTQDDLRWDYNAFMTDLIETAQAYLDEHPTLTGALVLKTDYLRTPLMSAFNAAKEIDYSHKGIQRLLKHVERRVGAFEEQKDLILSMVFSHAEDNGRTVSQTKNNDGTITVRFSALKR